MDKREEQNASLRERIKELDCLYEILMVPVDDDVSLSDVLGEAVGYLQVRVFDGSGETNASVLPSFSVEHRRQFMNKHKQETGILAVSVGSRERKRVATL